jgi:hypothetical protein
VNGSNEVTGALALGARTAGSPNSQGGCAIDVGLTSIFVNRNHEVQRGPEPPATGVSGIAGPSFVPLATPIPAPLETPSRPAVSLELGEPLRLTWTLTNKSDVPVSVPSDIRIESQHAFITVTNPNGVAKPMPSFVIQTDAVQIRELAPGKSLRAETWVFWSSVGFAFETPGRHIVGLRVVWTRGGAPFGVRATIEVWVNYPRSTIDNEAADILLDREIGMYVALGGGAAHLTGAVARLERVKAMDTEIAEV